MLSHAHLLRRLVAPESQSSPSTFNDGARSKATKNAGLVIICGIEGGRNSVVRVGKGALTCWAYTIPSRCRGEA